MLLTCTAFADGLPIPREFTGDSMDRTPEFNIDNPPANVKSYALIGDDPDAPMDEPFVHWVLFDLPGDALRVDPYEDGAIEGINGFGDIGYGGPMPPKGHGVHRYFFKLYSLDIATLGLAEGATKKEVEAAMAGHIIAESTVMGTYERK